MMFERVLLTTKKWVLEIGHNTPIGILDLAPYLRKHGYAVDVFYLDDIPKEQTYDIVGLSVFGSDYKNKHVVKDVKRLRKRFPAAKIVIGGRWTHTVDQATIAKLGKFGAEIYKGQGEDYFVKNAPIDFDNYPAWERKDLEALKDFDNTMMTSRGCPYDCYFCHNIERKMKYFSAKRSAEIFKLLFDAGKDEIFIVDDVFTVKSEHMQALYDECLARNIPIVGRNQFFSHIGVIKEKTCEIMALFKPRLVQVGLESGDDGMLQRMSKGFDSKKAEDRIALLSQHVPIFGLFLIGYPGETKESLENTYNFVKRISPYLDDIWVSLFQPVPGTVGFEEAKTHGRMVNRGFQINNVVTYIDNNLSKRLLVHYKKQILSLAKQMGERKKAS